MTEEDAIYLINKVGYARIGEAIKVDGERIGFVSRSYSDPEWLAYDGTIVRRFTTQAQAIAYLIITKTRAGWDLLTVTRPADSGEYGGGPGLADGDSND